jgi:hypothetical protein
MPPQDVGGEVGILVAAGDVKGEAEAAGIDRHSLLLLPRGGRERDRPQIARRVVHDVLLKLTIYKLLS